MAIDDSIAMSDLVLHREALAMNTPELVTALADQLGFKLVAYLGKVKEPAPLSSGQREPVNSRTPRTSNGSVWPFTRPA